jgi:zinc transport system substrate-binding protein
MLNRTISILLFLFSVNTVYAKETVLVTLPPYAYLVKRISGDTVTVETLIPPGANPHLFEPTPQEVSKAVQAKLWFCIGEQLEGKILTALHEKNKNLVSIDLCQGIALMSGHDHGGKHHHHEEGKDRHLWLSPKLAKIQARTIAEALSNRFPDHRSHYQIQLQSLLLDLDLLDQQIHTALDPLKGKAILVSHPAFGYFCRDYGLRQISIECEGKDPLPHALSRIIKQAKETGVTTVFAVSPHNNKGAETIADRLHLPLITIDPYSSDYMQNMGLISELMKK